MDHVTHLIRRSQKRDLAAFEELVVLYQQRVYALSYQLTGNHDDAQELAQEVFVRAYRALETFRGEADFGTWLHRITVNLYLNMKKRRSSAELISLDEPVDTGDGEVTRELRAATGDPLEALEEREFREMVERALAELSPEQRAVLVLREIEGYSYEEIARLLGLSLGTVKSRLNRARESLKKKLSPMLRGSPDEGKAGRVEAAAPALALARGSAGRPGTGPTR
ncbi:sigma-70 family RNA polymerase sigma factor [Desulfovirgula thermocuniculi]|uniref:sigma-70 family RNA polymerase sigma factor n=1 Tax=Desulfovirgula thermocuniculi TaxID=348842 RepID=UPI0003FBE58E|nr:sigma-70 family RNA polymerase sigma factor [Desulfovirgula thermocuniculi]